MAARLVCLFLFASLPLKMDKRHQQCISDCSYFTFLLWSFLPSYLSTRIRERFCKRHEILRPKVVLLLCLSSEQQLLHSFRWEAEGSSAPNGNISTGLGGGGGPRYSDMDVPVTVAEVLFHLPSFAMPKLTKFLLLAQVAADNNVCSESAEREEYIWSNPHAFIRLCSPWHRLRYRKKI